MATMQQKYPLSKNLKGLVLTRGLKKEKYPVNNIMIH